MKVKITQAELDDIAERLVVDPEMLELLDEWWMSAGYGGDADDLRSYGPRAASYRDPLEDFEDMSRAKQREFALWLREQSQGRPVYTNPECFDGPDVSEYEGMHVQYKVGDFKFPKVSEALDFVKFSDKLGLFEDVRERVYAVYLSTDNKIIGYRLVSAGAIDASLADPKVIFGPALTLHAKSVALMHNHPSKSLTFSTQDKALAKKLISGGEMLDIALLDFVVVGDGKFLSLQEEMPGLFPG